MYSLCKFVVLIIELTLIFLPLFDLFECKVCGSRKLVIDQIARLVRKCFIGRIKSEYSTRSHFLNLTGVLIAICVETLRNRDFFLKCF